MDFRAATVHENSIFVLKQLCQLSQLEDIIDLNDQTLMLL